MTEAHPITLDGTILLTTPAGERVPLTRYIGRQNLVLFLMRAFG
ncbi:MAG: hypothetical protein ACOY93_02740 [Bacillota bacterium]